MFNKNALRKSVILKIIQILLSGNKRLTKIKCSIKHPNTNNLMLFSI